jgi:hypothetical protein
MTPSTAARQVLSKAKNPARAARFVPIVAKPEQASRGKSKEKPEPKLTRVAFKVSRLMEFCSQRELQNQTGHSVYDWPLVIAKELIDNALDAAEEAEVAPIIMVAVDKNTIIVEDNASGIDADTIASVLDYSIRVSSREAYVSPTRGAQGNALKTILAMSYVLDHEHTGDRAGVTIIEVRGVAHRIEFRVDHVNNQPKIIHTAAPTTVETGTRFTIHWPASDALEAAADEFKQLVHAYVWFNPHLTVRGTWFGEEFINNETATNPDWEKWRPRNPTSAHWYDQARLQRYLAAHVARDRDLGQSRTVREFIAEFRGLSRTGVRWATISTRRKQPDILPAAFAGASVDVIGPAGGLAGVLFCEKEGFNPLFKAVNLANRYDLMIVSTKGVSVTAARRLIDEVCGNSGLPLFTLHDFDTAGFLILGTLQRDTRRYQFSNDFEVVDLGLRLADIEGLEREPAAATKLSAGKLRNQLVENGALDAEIDVLVTERVELNAMASDALIAMIERKLKDHGLNKVVPDEDTLTETYRAFYRSHELRERFEEMEKEFDEEAAAIKIPTSLKKRVGAILNKHTDLRWDDGIKLVLDKTQLERVRADKAKAKKKSGDFTGPPTTARRGRQRG